MTAALLLKRLALRSQFLIRPERRLKSNAQISRALEIWRRHYDLVCQLIDGINDCFSLILAINICYCFVTSAKFSTQIFNKDGRSRWGSYFFILGQLYLRLGLIIFASYYVQRQVNTFSPVARYIYSNFTEIVSISKLFIKVYAFD